jgi:hypothetical protein
VQIRRALRAGVASPGLSLQLDLGTTGIAEHGGLANLCVQYLFDQKQLCN